MLQDFLKAYKDTLAFGLIIFLQFPKFSSRLAYMDHTILHRKPFWYFPVGITIPAWLVRAAFHCRTFLHVRVRMEKFIPFNFY